MGTAVRGPASSHVEARGDAPVGDGVAIPHDAPRRDWTAIALVVIVVLGVVLRAWRLGFSGLSYDETFTAMAARLPIDQLFDFLRTRDTHPPLDYLLRAPFARAGASDLVLRLPS